MPRRFKYLRCEPEEHFVLLTEPPLNTPENREVPAPALRDTSKRDPAAALSPSLWKMSPNSARIQRQRSRDPRFEGSDPKTRLATGDGGDHVRDLQRAGALHRGAGRPGASRRVFKSARTMSPTNESWPVPACLGPQALAASWTSKGATERTLTGTVIDSGDGVTHVIPVAEGYVIGSCIKHIPLVKHAAQAFTSRERDKRQGSLFAVPAVATSARASFFGSCRGDPTL